MGITFSRDQQNNLILSVSNLFITEYMPFAPDSYVKVYLYGLSLASSGSTSATIEEIAKRLSFDIKLVEEAYRYWDAQQIVNITQASPLEVEYLAVKSPENLIRKFKKEKYKTFNNQLHAMLPARNILPNEYNEYYNIIENYHIEIEAMLTIIAYCVRLKGESISYQYILTVARNLANDGLTTYDRVHQRLGELDHLGSEIGAVLKALKIKRTPDHEDRRLFIKWTKTLEFSPETIIFVAKSIKKGGVERLDSQLTKYYEARLMDAASIASYNEKRDSMFALARKINKIIGVYYEQLDFIIETYINKWLSYGFDEGTLLTCAEYCFRRGVRTLEGLNDAVMRFYKEGLLSQDSINSFIGEALKTDSQIKEILERAGLNRKITSWDRDNFRTWTFSWGMPMEVILYVAAQSVGKSSPLSYMNAVLSSYHESGIKTVAEAEKQSSAQKVQGAIKGAKSEIPSTSRNYTNEEINAMFDRLKPEDI